jgi:hypothetical protein
VHKLEKNEEMRTFLVCVGGVQINIIFTDNVCLLCLFCNVKLYNSSKKGRSLLLVWFRFMVFNATFNNISVISWQSVLLVEEIRVPEENHQAVASH